MLGWSSSQHLTTYYIYLSNADTTYWDGTLQTCPSLRALKLFILKAGEIGFNLQYSKGIILYNNTNSSFVIYVHS